MSEEDADFHPIELAAHSILSGSLDSLNENFLSLHRSQHILLTRLKMISERLNNIEKTFGEGISGKEVEAVHSQIRVLKGKLQESQSRLKKVEQRLGKLDG